MDSPTPTETTAPLWFHKSRQCILHQGLGLPLSGPRRPASRPAAGGAVGSQDGLRTASTAHRPLARGGRQGEFLHARQRCQTLQAGTVPSPFHRRKLRLGKSVMDPVCRVSPAGAPVLRRVPVTSPGEGPRPAWLCASILDDLGRSLPLPEPRLHNSQPFPALGGSETPRRAPAAGWCGNPALGGPLCAPLVSTGSRPPTTPGGCLPGAGNLVFQVF